MDQSFHEPYFDHSNHYAATKNPHFSDFNAFDRDFHVDDGTVSVLLGNGDGTLTGRLDYATGIDPYCVAAGDLNGDGRPDLATADLGAATASVLLGRGDGIFGSKTDFPTGGLPHSVAVGDRTATGFPTRRSRTGWRTRSRCYWETETARLEPEPTTEPETTRCLRRSGI